MKKILINDIPTKEINIDNDILLIDLLVLCSLAKSKTEAKRLILQNGIKIDGEKEKNIDKIIKISLPNKYKKANNENILDMAIDKM